MEGKIKAVKEEINNLDKIAESKVVSAFEANRRRELSAGMHKLLNLNCSIQWKKSRVKWLKEDINSKYFHGCINNRRKNNEIMSLKINGRVVKKDKEIKRKVHE
ncbi:unnamed protein product [Lathyrus sativus]|nr:unnamed protein product [Lathyrus sativus]